MDMNIVGNFSPYVYLLLLLIKMDTYTTRVTRMSKGAIYLPTSSLYNQVNVPVWRTYTHTEERTYGNELISILNLGKAIDTKSIRPKDVFNDLLIK